MRALLALLSLLLLPAAAKAEGLEPAAQAVGRLRPEGLRLSLSVEGGLLERDLWGGGALGIGYEHDAFALHLRAPLYLRALDLPPQTPRPAGVCGVVRCEVVGLHEEGFELEGVSRLVEELRLGRPGSSLYVRGGPLFATLGTGRLVERYLNSPDPDRPQSGLLLEAELPFLGLSVEALVGNLFVPQKLAAGRAAVRPLRLLSFFEEEDALSRFLGRFAVALEVAGDFVLPDAPFVRAAALSRPLLGSSLELSWPLFDEGGWFQLSPFVAGSALYGLSSSGGVPAELGAGASAGGRLELLVPFVGLRVDGAGVLDSPGHRTGVFGLLYDVERRQALAGSVLEGGGLAHVPAPGGAGYTVGAELVVVDALRLGARYRRDTAPGGSTGEAFAELALFSFRAGTHIIRRGLERPEDTLAWDERTLVVTEAAWGFWGPFSVFGRWMRAPRFVGGKLRTDDDVMVGVSVDLAIAPAEPDEG